MDGNTIDYAINLNSIGNNYSKLGNPSLAIQFYLKSLDIRKEKVDNDDPKLGIIYHNLGNMYKLLDKSEEAYSYYNRALDNYELAFGEPSEQVGFVYNSLGNYFFDKLKFDQALLFYKKGLLNRKKVLHSNNRFILHSYYNIANSFLQIGQLDSAKNYIELAINNNPISKSENIRSTNFDHIDYLKDYAYSYWLDGEILFSAYKRDNNIKFIKQSSQSFNESVQSYYQLLKIQDHESSKFALVQDLRNSIIGPIECQIVIDSLNGKQNFITIYDLFEKSHNSQLFELLRKVTFDNKKETEKEDLVEVIDYKRQLETIKKSDTSNYNYNTQELSNLYNKITAYEGRQNTLQNNLYKSETSYADFISFTSQLDEKILILQFLVSPKTDQVFFFSVSKNWQKYGFLSSYETFRSLSENFSNAVKKFELTKANEYSISLSNLIKEAIPRDFNNYNRLIIIPDEFIWSIPFDALKNPIETNRYLIEDFNITLHLSCNLLSFNKGKDLFNYSYDFIGFAPSFTNSMNSDFQNIPSAKREVVEAAKNFIDNGYNSYCLLDTNADLKSFINLSHTGRIMHFATHFNYNSTSSKQGLLLSPQADDCPPEIIGYEEVLLTGASSELVVLSACKSVSGSTDIKGEGPINLNRAFIMNGTRYIIYSINKIDDEFSKEFSDTFQELTLIQQK